MKKFLLSVFLLFGFLRTLQATNVVFDKFVTLTVAAGTTAFTYNYTPGVGPNPAIVISVMVQDSEFAAVTNVSYNGLTGTGSQVQGTGWFQHNLLRSLANPLSNTETIDMYAAANLPAGNNNVVVTVTNAAAANVWAVNIESFLNVASLLISSNASTGTVHGVINPVLAGVSLLTQFNATYVAIVFATNNTSTPMTPVLTNGQSQRWTLNPANINSLAVLGFDFTPVVPIDQKVCIACVTCIGETDHVASLWFELDPTNTSSMAVPSNQVYEIKQ